MSEEIKHDRRNFLGTAAINLCRRPARHDPFCLRAIQQDNRGRRAHFGRW
jgi:hypothetical protein